MRLLTFFRAMAWFGVVVVFWSLNVRWGTDANLPSGPPGPWHRAVVGAGLLTFIAAVALSASGRKGNPPSWLARGIAGACALAVLYIAFNLYNEATGPYADWSRGIGWTWLVAGSGMVASAVLGSLGLRPTRAAIRDKARQRKRRR